MFSDKKNPSHHRPNTDYESFDLTVSLDKSRDGKSRPSALFEEEEAFQFELSDMTNRSFDLIFEQHQEKFLECLKDAEVEQARFIQKLNASLEDRLAGVTLTPWAMVPGSIWQSKAAALLFLKCRLLPTDRWNMFLMPADFESGCALSMPVHPGAEASVLNDAFTDFLFKLDAEYSDAFDQLLAQKSLALLQTEETFSSVVNQVKARIIHQARKLTASYFGESVFERHEELFGAYLGQR